MLSDLNIPEYIIFILDGLYMITVVSIAILLMLENRNPVKSVSWIMVLILLPILGLILYVFFGQNLRKQKIISRKSIKQVEMINGYYDAVKRQSHGNFLKLDDEDAYNKKIVSLLYKNNHSLLTNDNKATLLNDGIETFDAIIKELKKAQRFIHLEYYIFDQDNIGKQVTNILKDKAVSGVNVRVIVDDVGSWHLNNAFFNEMREAGIEIYPFLKVRFPFFTSRINYRNHRKIIVIDGKVGFTGGLNIADRYISGSPGLGGKWRDTHLRVEGSAVNSLQSIFILDWYFVSQKRIQDKSYFPAHAPAGDVPMQILSSSPDGDWKTLEQAFFMAITEAKKSVYITTPYFLPTESIRMALATVALSGVDVRIIIPGRSDAYMTHASSLSYVRGMLEAGVKVYFYDKGFIHSKVLVIDQILSSVGTANMDFRSFEYNFEVTAFMYDKGVGKELVHTFRQDLHDSTEITLAEWRKRPLLHKLSQSFARLFSPLL